MGDGWEGEGDAGYEIRVVIDPGNRILWENLSLQLKEGSKCTRFFGILDVEFLCSIHCVKRGMWVYFWEFFEIF